MVERWYDAQLEFPPEEQPVLLLLDHDAAWRGVILTGAFNARSGWRLWVPAWPLRDGMVRYWRPRPEMPMEYRPPQVVPNLP